MKKIATVSRRLRFVLWAFLIASPCATGAFWIFGVGGLDATGPIPAEISYNLAGNFIPRLSMTTINATSLSLGFLAAMIPTCALMFIVYILTKIFRNYERGLIFSEHNTMLYRRIGFGLFAKTIADIVSLPLICLALTFQNPVKPEGVIQVGTTHLGLIFVGVGVILISWVMDEASKIAEEQAYTI
jgi:hypothetical protein